MKKIEIKLQLAPDDIRPVGILAEQNHRIFFEYDSAFLETHLQLSPFKLPAKPGLIEHKDFNFGILPGLFDDSLPDGWGLLLMDRYFQRQGFDPATLSPLDRLAFLSTRTMGALTYHPPADRQEYDDKLIDLYELGVHAEKIIKGNSDEVLPQLMRVGGSPGGARPKVLVGLSKSTGSKDQLLSGEADLPEGFEHWMVKFFANQDSPDSGAVEYAYYLMAKAAGIDIPAARLFEVKNGADTRRFFGVKRFDRDAGNRRFHVHTFANLIHANFRIPSTDYRDLFKTAQALTRNHADLLELFRRMVFNIAAHNRDDHAKNFAFVLDDKTGQWALSPAYDLTFSSGPGGEHTTAIYGEGRNPTRKHCLQLAREYSLKSRETNPIIEQVNSAVSRWNNFAKEAGCLKQTAQIIEQKLSIL